MSLTWALALTLLAGAAGAVETSTAAVSNVESSTEVFAWRSTAPLTLDAVLGHFEVFDARLRTLQAHFTQTLTMAEGGLSSTVEGTVAYKKPELLRIEHTRPERQTVVSDGGDVWIYRHSIGQVIQSTLADWKQADPLINNLLRFGDYGRMLKEYSVTLRPEGPRPVLELRPKEKSQGDFRLSLTLDPGSLFPERTDLLVGATRVRTELDRVRFNPALDESLFRFTPPEGADVFRNFKPPRFKQ